MYKAAAKILSFFAIYLIIFMALKPVFMALYLSLMGDITASDWFDVIWHGLPMDCSVAGYFTLLPALTVTLSTLCGDRFTGPVLKIYALFSAMLISMVYILDFVLYGYWNFRLDATPLFYFFSSPSSAMASAGWGTVITGIVSLAVLSTAIYMMLRYTAMRIPVEKSRSVAPFVLSLLLTAALFIPIRGSFTVSTMNLSRSYYSDNQRLNHAAVNPVFSLLYSLTHQTDFASQFRYFNNDDAERIVSDIFERPCTVNDSTSLVLKDLRPDVYIIILESFSAHLMPSLGGENIASGLDSLASHGLLFTNFYASGARTDRAIPAILSAFPAQPTTSLMKYTNKVEHTPSLPRKLKEKGGYNLTYYYGGDANFTNMMAYMVSSGFDKIVSDKDFPLSKRTSKWGVHDDAVFSCVLDDVRAGEVGSPALRVIQTSSSHEPFDVPYSDPRFADSDRKNAFAYADHCVTAFIDSLHSSPVWDRSLILITADHYGVYPQHIDKADARHHVPFIITGGAVTNAPGIVDRYGDHTAIAATLLNALGIDAGEFRYSRDLFSPCTEGYAFYTEPGIAGFSDRNSSVAISLDNDAIIESYGENADSAAIRCKALLQSVYTTLSEL